MAGELIAINTNEKEFIRQNGRVARLWDIVRFKKSDGTFHKQAEWYVKTKFGWRKARTGQARPTYSEIETVIKTSRKGR